MIMMLMVVFGFVLPVVIVAIFYMLVWNQLKSRNLQVKNRCSNDRSGSSFEELNFRSNSFKLIHMVPPNRNAFRASSLDPMELSMGSKNDTVVFATQRKSAVNFNSILFKARDMSLINTKKEIKITKTLILFVLVFLLTW